MFSWPYIVVVKQFRVLPLCIQLHISSVLHLFSNCNKGISHRISDWWCLCSLFCTDQHSKSIVRKAASQLLVICQQSSSEEEEEEWDPYLLTLFATGIHSQWLLFSCCSVSAMTGWVDGDLFCCIVNVMNRYLTLACFVQFTSFTFVLHLMHSPTSTRHSLVMIWYCYYHH